MSNAPVTLIPSETGYVDRAEVLRQVAPPRTRTWNPIPHKDLMGWVENALAHHGWQINREQEKHTLAHDGETWFGVFPINHEITGGVDLACGVRNDVGKRLSGSFLAGRQVYICANLDFSSELMAIHKHTNQIANRLPRMIYNVAGRLAQYCDGAKKATDAMRETKISQVRSDHELVQMVRHGIIPQTELMKVSKIYDTDDRWGPRHTVWRLHNATTAVLQRRLETNAPSFATRTVKLNRQMERLIQEEQPQYLRN